MIILRRKPAGSAVAFAQDRDAGNLRPCSDFAFSRSLSVVNARVVLNSVSESTVFLPCTEWGEMSDVKQPI